MAGWRVMAVVALCAAIARAQDEVKVPREEWEAIKKDLAELKALRRDVTELRQEIATLKKEKGAHQTETNEALDTIDKEVREVKEQIAASKPGETSFLLSGNATLSYVNREETDSTFNAVFRPLFLWRFNEKLMFEGKLELRLDPDADDTDVFVEAANLSYVLNDYVILGAGKFLTPFGLYPDRFYPGKFADDPLPFARSGIAPHSSVGAFARGAAPLGEGMEFNYAAYVSNGPTLRTGESNAGSLSFAGGTDTNDGKSVGGRIGFLPFPALEIGYSILYGQVAPSGFGNDTWALIQGVDLQWLSEVDLLKGVVDLRIEYVWSDVDHATYFEPGPDGFGPLNFNNKRSGGYVELSYRPTQVPWKELKKLELVGRFDWLDVPRGAPGFVDEKRLTLGVLYWLTSTISLRAAYQFDDRKRAKDQDALFLQIGVGL